MRARSIALLAVTASLLSGCTTPLVTAPAEPELPPLGLVGMWRVDAPTENADTWLRVEDGYILHRDDCLIEGDWLATQVEFVASRSSYRGPCVDHAFEEPLWLASAVAFRASGSGWELVDADGEITATLIATLPGDDWPEGIADAQAKELSPPRVSERLRERSDPPPPLPDGLDVATADDLLGRWVPVSPTEASPYLRFLEGAQVATSDGCNNTESRWLVSDSGRLLTTGFMTTLVGCDGVAIGELLHESAVAGLDAEGHLHLVDASGHELLALVRED